MNDVDVDSIPIVRLEDMPSLIPGASLFLSSSKARDNIFLPEAPVPTLPSLRTTSRSFVAEPFVIDREGEMPDAAVRPQSEASRQQTPALPEGKTSPPQMSSFPAYEVVDDAVRTSTPDPIKVTSKKKGTGKKRRTPTTLGPRTGTGSQM
jgi:AP-3 complex subunit delta-1